MSFFSEEDEDNISDVVVEENNGPSRMLGWSSVMEEAKELMLLNENAALSHFANYDIANKKICSRGKGKTKYSFRFGSDRNSSFSAKDKIVKSEVHEKLVGLEDIEPGAKRDSMSELLEGLQKENKKLPDSQQVVFDFSAGGNRHIEHPVAEILQNLIESNGPPKGTAKMNLKTLGKRSKLTAKSNKYTLAYRFLDSGDPPEPLDSSTSSDEEDAKFQLQVFDENLLNIGNQEVNEQTMAHRFQEALDAAAIGDQGMLLAKCKQTGLGYHASLQQVMQTEKERQMEFLKQSHAGIHGDKATCIDVEILSRYFDAKLIVCECSLCCKNIMACSHNIILLFAKPSGFFVSKVLNMCSSSVSVELPMCRETPKKLGRECSKTIIFSSRICNNVELEVGSSVRIYPPW
ncbi:hypothetical protein IFM89_006806 [Coptis chinensis]|uniref:Uncharacterized protein n=1 Tax=Coptis chinensis TaxID=261450 RepID=A0A835HSA6_9MAGN|nr:hypothetical protein IFM89_006806 [Coptis chinensis]